MTPAHDRRAAPARPRRGRAAGRRPAPIPSSIATPAAALPAALIFALLAALWLAVAPAPGGAWAQAASAPEAPAAGAAPAPDAPPALPTATQLHQDAAALDHFFETWADNARRAEDALADADASVGAFEVLREGLADDRDLSRTLADRISGAIEPLRRELEPLLATAGDGAPAPADGAAPDDAASPPPPPAAVAADIESLQARIALLDGFQRQAERAYARADALIGEIDVLARARRTDELFTMGPSPLVPSNWRTAGVEYLDLARRVVNEVVYNLRNGSDGLGGLRVVGTLFGAVAVALALAFVVRGKLIMAVAAWAGPDPSLARRTAASSLAALLGLAAPGLAVALFATAVDRSGLLGPAGRALAEPFIGGLIFTVLARGLSQAFLAPHAPNLRVAALNDKWAVRGSHAVVVLIFGVLGHAVFAEGAHRAGLSLATVTAANALWVTVATYGLWRLTRLLKPRGNLTAPAAAPPPGGAPAEAEDGPQLGRRIAVFGVNALRVVAVVAVLLGWAGFLEASDLLFFSPILTLGLTVLGVLLFHLISDGVEAYIEGRAQSAEGESDGLRLIPLMVMFLLGCAALPLVALIWGARPEDIAEAWKLVVDGVEVGGVSLSPINILTFVLVFGIGYSLTRLLQTVLATSVLPKTRMDAGGRSALVSGLGYIGFGLAALFAVSSVGLDLSNLAIVAGALSVGIGFGLQTIVNNFVSGIILLVERPIKIGDWIEVGGTHGMVRRVSVRATQIETFDRSHLILPNSELISGRVVNFTHGNNVGRTIIKVGVAYGSDVRKVERILREIAEAETRALQHPPPQILFRGFGADSLDFEMRLLLRDIFTIIHASSDLHFEVERRFREEGIEIPFAQRVLHVADPDRLGRALRGEPPASPAASAAEPREIDAAPGAP